MGTPANRLFGLTSLAAFFLVGCVSSGLTTAQLLPGYELPPKPSFVVLAIADGQEHGQAPAGGTGREIQFLLLSRVMAFGFQANPSQSQDVNVAFAEGDRLGFTHVLKGTFTHWEDNATEWSGNPDRISFMVEVYAVDGRRFLGTVSRSAEGSVLAATNESTSRFLKELAIGTLEPILRPAPKAE